MRRKKYQNQSRTDGGLNHTVFIVAIAMLALGVGCAGSSQHKSAESTEAVQGADGGGDQAAAGQEGARGDKTAKKMKMSKEEIVEAAPARGYLAAHSKLKKPRKLLGGGIEVTVTQDAGGVFVSLPDKRELDEDVFGSVEMPRSWAGSPGVTGVPPMARGQKNGKYTKMKKMSPFGDKHMVMPNGKLMMKAVDKTATDAASSEDSVKLKASWQDEDGNTYEVMCCKMLAIQGVEYPTFGGVVTNHIMHGWSRIGTPLMPTMFTYAAFWGMGSVSKNGEVLDKPRIVHGMLTEYVRTEGYKLAMDDEVTPTRLQFHLMVAPVMPNKEMNRFEPKPVKTGLKLKNGKELPFWHVMFENLDVQSNSLEE